MGKVKGKVSLTSLEQPEVKSSMTMTKTKAKTPTKTKTKAKTPTKTKSKTPTKTKAKTPTKTKAKTPAKTKVKAKTPTKTKTKAKTPTKKKSKVKKKTNGYRRIWVPTDFGPLFQFKIELLDSHPLIWRRIQVPANFTFDKLHLAIQSAMGWRNCHLHEFEMYDGTRIGIPIPELPEINPLDENEELIARRFDLSHEFNDRMIYDYDFGDHWVHVVKLEKTLQAIPGKLYPVCVGGKRACPPEDLGGVDGYERFLKILKNPKHEEYEDMKEWADDYGWGGDPSHFNPAECDFYSWYP